VIQVVVNADSLNQLLGDLKRKSGNIRPALVGIAGIMMDSTEENFEMEGRPRWPDLAESTKKARAKKGKYPGKTLQVKGQLAASISPKVTESSALVGTNKKYAAIHQFGGPAGRKHAVDMPERPFLKITKRDVEQAEFLLIRHLLK
jgi:phage virion morphogenesis protein